MELYIYPYIYPYISIDIQKAFDTLLQHRSQRDTMYAIFQKQEFYREGESNKSKKLKTGNTCNVQLPGQVRCQLLLRWQAFEVLVCGGQPPNLVLGLKHQIYQLPPVRFTAQALGMTEAASMHRAGLKPCVIRGHLENPRSAANGIKKKKSQQTPGRIKQRRGKSSPRPSSGRLVTYMQCPAKLPVQVQRLGVETETQIWSLLRERKQISTLGYGVSACTSAVETRATKP